MKKSFAVFIAGSPRISEFNELKPASKRAINKICEPFYGAGMNLAIATILLARFPV